MSILGAWGERPTSPLPVIRQSSPICAPLSRNQIEPSSRKHVIRCLSGGRHLVHCQYGRPRMIRRSATAGLSYSLLVGEALVGA
jgi:hypothetical protein